MLKNCIKITFRNFGRNRSSFAINIISLSVGMACALLIYLWVSDELSIDTFNKNDDQLYQVMQNFNNPSGIRTLEWTPAPLANSLAEEMPEIEYATSVFPPSAHPYPTILSVDNEHIKADTKFAGNDYFKLFSYELIRGDKDQVLNEKKSVVISDALAIKLFGSTDDVVGKTLEWDEGEMADIYSISGIFREVPSNASIQFDAVFNIDLYVDKHPDLTRWDYNDPSTYMMLKEQANTTQFSAKIADFIKTKYPQSKGSLFLRKYSDQYLYGNYKNGKVSGGRIAYVRLFSIIAIFVLLIACINFMNLSTARSFSRFKEIGVRKSMGASRLSLIAQYLSESIILSFFGMVVALLFAELLLPAFNNLTDKHIVINYSDPFLLLKFAGVALFTGCIAGSYPALYLSGFHPVTILKGKVENSVSSFWVRKGLVVFQFTISVIMIVSVLVVYRQMEFVQSKNLGYEKDNVIFFDNNGIENQNLDTFLSEIEKIPGITNATAMRGDMTSGDHNHTPGLYWEGQGNGEEIEFTSIGVHRDFFETLGIEMAEGRCFSADYSTEDSKIIFNEAAIKSMGLENPVGKMVNLWGSEKQIVGVVKDFHFESLYKEVSPTFFRLVPDASNIFVKIKAGEEQTALTQLQDFYQKNTQGVSLDFQFLDQAYQKLYASEQRVSVLFRYFAGLAIIISCLGLFGLATFTANKRLKEIGIRKVLGASVTNIITLLSKDFIQMVLVAILIATPIAWYTLNEWLSDFVYRIDFGLGIFGIAGGAALVIAVLTVSWQSIKAALMNPVNSLRSE